MCVCVCVCVCVGVDILIRFIDDRKEEMLKNRST
jgi:hypothetical protein